MKNHTKYIYTRIHEIHEHETTKLSEGPQQLNTRLSTRPRNDGQTCNDDVRRDQADLYLYLGQPSKTPAILNCSQASAEALADTPTQCTGNPRYYEPRVLNLDKERGVLTPRGLLIAQHTTLDRSTTRSMHGAQLLDVRKRLTPHEWLVAT